MVDTAAIYYQQDAFSTENPKLMGRNAAGETFLGAYLKYSQAKKYYVFTNSKTDIQHFSKRASIEGKDIPIDLITHRTIKQLEEVGTLFYPGPVIANFAFQRKLIDKFSWSICGITHTTSSSAVMDAISNWCVSPVQEWDAVICTSSAVQNHVKTILQKQEIYLKKRLGISRFISPQLPVIPLGIHVKNFEFTKTQKAESKSTLGIDQNALVCLYLGRLSFHAKAHPLAMYQALEIAAKSTNKKIILIECGWYANEHIKKAFNEAAKLACPSIEVMQLDGRIAENRDLAWSAGDIFCSLSDNIQETFGIVPIEAMAAGLPVVVSDWDGYKDTVRDGIDGFRIPTLIPEKQLGSDLATRYALELDNYDMYCGHTCSLISVDVQAAARAFITLFNNSDLRDKMSAMASQRAKEIYDWSVIFPQYEQLWTELKTIRKKHKMDNPNQSYTWPARLSPFEGFSHYATKQLNINSFIELVDKNPRKSLELVLSYKKLKMISFADFVIPSDDEIKQIIYNLKDSSVEINHILSSFIIERRPYILRSFVWLFKLNIIQFSL